MSKLTMLTNRLVRGVYDRSRTIEESARELEALWIEIRDCGEPWRRATLLIAVEFVRTVITLAVFVGVPALLSAVRRRGRHHATGLLLTLGLAAILLGIGLLVTGASIPGRGDRSPSGPDVVAELQPPTHLAARLTSYAVAVRELTHRLAVDGHDRRALPALAFLAVWAAVLIAAASVPPGGPAPRLCPARATTGHHRRA